MHVVTSRQIYDDATASLLRQESLQGVIVHRLWSARFGRGRLLGRALDYLTFYIAAAHRLWRLTEKGDLLVAKTDPPLISVVAAWVAKRRRAKMVNWLQDLFPEIAAALGIWAAKGPLYTVLKRARNWSLMVSSSNIVLGELMARRIANQGVHPERIRVISNWADGELIYPIDPEINSLRKIWGLDGKFVVGYSGNLGRAHEFDTILNAAEVLRYQERLVFLVIGGGARLQALTEEVQRRNLANFVFKPYQKREQLAESLSVSDMHLISLKPELEGLIVPSKFYGIAAAGRCCVFIGDPEGEIAKVLSQEGMGFSIASGDSQSLAGCITRMMRDHAQLHEMGQKSREIFESRYSKNRAIDAWASLIRDLV